MDANRTLPVYELKDELARQCLPKADVDPNRRLAWVNSICLLFLVIGLAGAKSSSISLKKLKPLAAEVVPVLVEPPTPVTPAEPTKVEPTEQETPQSPMVAVTLDTPAINFSVPTIGNVLVPNQVAPAPPLNPMQPVAPITGGLTSVSTTGSRGERPAPKYPDLAIQEMQEGAVSLLITANKDGRVTAVVLAHSSGHPLLDRTALDFVKKNWTLPRGATDRQFETTIKFQLKPDVLKQ